MESARYTKIRGDFEVLTQWAARVSIKLTGTTVADEHLKYADAIFTKLTAHALSLLQLSPKPSNEGSPRLWDVPSACAIARCLIESHDVLGYMTSESSGNELDFRVRLWRLHDQQRRLRMLRSLGSIDPRADEIKKSAAEMLAEIVEHPCFSNMRTDLQKKVQSGDAPAFSISQRELNKLNGVNHGYHTTATMWLSQYVHTLPMSVHQLQQFRAGTPDALHMSSMPLQYSASFLANAVAKMIAVFPKGKVPIDPDEARAFALWGSFAIHGSR